MAVMKIFVSYAREDHVARRYLEQSLAPLVDSGAIEIYHDFKLHNQEQWLPQLQQAMAACDGAILLLSPDFFASSFVREREIPVILERNTSHNIPVLPLLVAPCNWQDKELAKRFTIRPRDERPLTSASDPRWAEVVEEVGRWPSRDAGLNSGPSPARVDLSRLPIPASPKFFGHYSILKDLDAWLTDPGVHMVGIIAPGGVGKSALAHYWLQEIKPGFGGCAVVFGWSFYSQGHHDTQTTSVKFFEQAWQAFAVPDGMPLHEEEQARRLAQRLSEQPSLLVLDGVEPLQHAPQVQDGVFKDLGLYRLLRTVATNGLHHNGLILITSRQPLRELEGVKGLGYREIQLPHLENDEGTHLLRSLGVTVGRWEEFHQAVEETHGHPLSLLLMGRLLVDCFERDIARRDEVGPLVQDGKDPVSRHARRVMHYYVNQIWTKDAPEPAFLRCLGLFDRPMEDALWQVLRRRAQVTAPFARMPGRDFRRMLAGLRQIGLLLDSKDGDTHYDAHPMVREWFGDNLATTDPQAFQQAHALLFDHFCTLPAQHQPDTLAELEPLYRAVHHGCRAGRYHEAWQVLYQRIYRGEKYYSLAILGAISSSLGVLAGFFPEGWEGPPVSQGLSEPEQGELMADAAYCLMALGRMREAVGLRQASIKLCEKLQGWSQASVSAQNLANILILTGDLTNGLTAARKAFQWARKSGNLMDEVGSLSFESLTLHLLGRLTESRERFQAAEAVLKKWRPELPHLHSFPGAWYYALLLEGGEGDAVWKEGVERGNNSLNTSEWPLSVAYSHLTIGRALAPMGESQEAGEHLNQAVDSVKKAGSTLHTPPILLDRGAFLLDQGQHERARVDLDEALEIVLRCGMFLYEADARLLETRFLLHEKKDARVALARAEQLIEKCHYGRRLAELEIIRAQLLQSRGDIQGSRQARAAARRRIEETGQLGLRRLLE